MKASRFWACAALLVVAAGALAAGAQTKLEFDVASIKQNKTDARMHSNFPIGPGDMYGATGGRFSGTALPLEIYIMFAYKMTDHEVQSMEKQLPKWAVEERYDVEAKTEKTNATKDEMRQMMRSLLADRLKLAVHRTSEEVAVYDLVLTKPGKMGPRLRPHPVEDTSCSNAIPAPGTAPPAPMRTDGFPVTCGGLAGMPASAPGLIALGYRNVPLKLIALQLTDMGALDKPVVDATGLSGNFDFALEFARERPPEAISADNDAGGPSFREALAEQAGLKLVGAKASVDVIVIDHIERPSAN